MIKEQLDLARKNSVQVFSNTGNFAVLHVHLTDANQEKNKRLSCVTLGSPARPWLAQESSTLARYNKKPTITSREIQTALTCCLLPIHRFRSQMTGSGGSDLRALIFNGDNYEFWKIQMRTIFKLHGIWDLVEKGLGISESKGKKVDEEGSSESEKVSLLMKDAKALGIIQGAVSDDIFPRISNEETSKDAWDVLHIKSFMGLRRDFEYTRIKDDETLSVYLTRLLELVNQMKGYEEDLSKGRLVQKLLISLTKEFDPVCYVIEQTKDIETIEVQEVLAALRGFAQRLDRHAESTTEKAFSSMSINQKGSQSNSSFGNNKSKKNWKSTGQKWDSKSQNNVNQGRKHEQGEKSEQTKGKCKHCDKLHYGECWFKGKPKCYGCNRFGHYIKDCDQANKAGKVANIANQSTGKGTLVIEMQGVTRYIKEVMIVPGLDENLLSVGQMVEHGYWLVFGDNVVDIYGDRQMQDLIASHKSQAFNIFKRFKNMVELQSGYQIKKLRSDRGGEYTSLEFSKFCEEMD
ncbi:Histone superfamily protein [Prunus dulcis]|uniref:Histone superfamily protein n=1 Tax=Prunus dulcis TaxID=3755 RepID=A0A4Y1QNJ6_PRUDU|nr:Histone superfamily protein [Prunus dulcis]